MEKKIILCKNYDDIIWFDGTVLYSAKLYIYCSDLPSWSSNIPIYLHRRSVVDPHCFNYGYGSWSRSIFYLNADPDLDSGQTFKSQKVVPYIKIILIVGNRSKNVPKKRTYKKHYWKAGSQIHTFILANFHAPGSGAAFPNGSRKNLGTFVFEMQVTRFIYAILILVKFHAPGFGSGFSIRIPIKDN